VKGTFCNVESAESEKYVLVELIVILCMNGDELIYSDGSVGLCVTLIIYL
jgi:hypothetical protein